MKEVVKKEVLKWLNAGFIYVTPQKPVGSLTNRQPAEIPVDIIYLGTHVV